MKFATLAALLAGILAGCSEKRVEMRAVPLTQDQVQTDALSVTMVVPKERYSTGDMIEVFLRVTNLTNHPITIPAMTSPRVQVVMYRDTPVGWQRLQEYPGGVLELDRSWVLAPGAEGVVDAGCRGSGISDRQLRAT